MDDMQNEIAKEKIVRPMRRKEMKHTPKTKEDKIGKFMTRSTVKNQTVKTPRKFNLWKLALSIVVIAVIVAGGLGGYYFYHKYRNRQTSVPVSDVDTLTTAIGKLIILPNETPTIATVTDIGKLKGQPFFANAQNGDKALIYTQAKKAILYRPSINKIVEVMYISADQKNNSATPGQVNQDQTSVQNQNQTQAPVAAGSDTTATATADTTASNGQATQSVTAATAKPVNAIVWNGTPQKGLTVSISNKLASITEVKIISTGNAKGDYPGTTIVDLTGNNANEAKKIADTLGGTVGSLPVGEIKPTNADILVIGGSDFKN